MSTQDPSLPQNVAGATPEQIADQIAAQQVSSGEPPQLQREYVVEVAGSVFRGKTQQEVIDAMQQSIAHGNADRKRQKDELEALKAQLEQQAPYVQQFQQQQAQNNNPWNPNRYYEVWAQDPMGAEAALIDRMLQQRYGVSLDQFAQQVQRAHQFAEEVEPGMIASSWAVGSSFPTVQKNSSPEEIDDAAKAFETVWNEYYPNDFDITPQKLDQIHAVALMRGLYKPSLPQTGQVEIQPQSTQPQSNPFPTLNTGGSGSTGGEQDWNRATPEQIRAAVDQLNSQSR